MKFRTKLLGGIAALCALGGIALAQVGVPTLWIVSPNGQESINATAYAPGAQIASVAVASLRDASGYQKVIPVTSDTVTVGDGGTGCSPVSATAGSCVSILQLTPAGTLAALTIKTPLFPVDGQRMEIFSTQILTSVTMTASQSQTLNGALTTIASANTGAAWVYSKGSSATNGTWDRYR